MALFSLNGKQITSVPHSQNFNALVRALGARRADEVRDYLDKVIHGLSPNDKTGLRTFSSSYLGSSLSPWQSPLSHLYVVSHEFADAKAKETGTKAVEKEIQDQAALFFGLFVWERIVDSNENWVVYDPNLSVHDTNREFMGKVYFEKG